MYHSAVQHFMWNYHVSVDFKHLWNFARSYDYMRSSLQKPWGFPAQRGGNAKFWLDVTFSGYGLSQWKTTLHCNVISHWLSPYQEWSLCISQWKCMPYHSTSLGLPHTSPSLQTTPGAILRWHSSQGAVFVMANTSGTTLTTAYHIEALTHGAFWPILLRKLTQVYLHPKHQ